MKIFSRIYFFYFILFFSTAAINNVFAQCTNPILTFPYFESFENNNGNWTRNTSTHWDWGAIVPGTKSVITSAATGQKCWIVGGLSGANYNSGSSYIQSPCFDFSSLTNPEISVSIFWETEKTYDGAHLEYTIDEGLTWNLLGSSQSNSNCVGINWYNSASVRFLNSTAGWSGSILGGSGGNCQSGNGSGQWLTAKHNIGFLAGRNKVSFRFVFGAGSVCNNYEGFAFDDFKIYESTASNTGFTYQCTGNNTVHFLNTQRFCQTSFSWNFGDPLSGNNNLSSLENPTHIFTAPGTYQVSETINFSNSLPITVNTSIVILGVNPQIMQPLLCYGDQNGVLTANPTGASGIINYNYSWNTSPNQQTQTISNLSANTYTVNVSANNTCPASASITLIEPDSLKIAIVQNNATCNLNNGSINVNVTGGSGIYLYSWSNNESTASIQNLYPGNYQLVVQDAHGCIANSPGIYIGSNNTPLNINLGPDTIICNGETLRLHPGTYAHYLWQDQSVNDHYIVSQPGTYSVEVINDAGCKARDEINVVFGCNGIYFPNSFTPDGDNLNDDFGVLGDRLLLRNFSLTVYNRWGQKVFYTTNPFIKWNGMYKGKRLSMETLAWISTYQINGIQQFKKGAVTILK